MKIAIMTQPLGHNYGGIMQAWALQQVLKNAGHDPVTVDRQPDAKSPAYNAARIGYRFVQKMMGKRKGPINIERHLPYILQNTQAFIDQHISMSERIDSTVKLKAHFEREQYDAVIIGSDQIWRPCYSPNIDNYFLDFLQGSNIKRIAYASSFGVDEWEFTEGQTRRCALLAKQFDAISVRERSGVDRCKKYLGVDATHVLDPTLLMENKTYEALYKKQGLPARQGIYTYILDQAEWKDRVIEAVKQAFNKPQFSNQPAEKDLSKLSGEILDDFTFPSLAGWIKGFAESDFVITDSFHGTVFSIIFNKPFITLVNSERGTSRFTSLLGQVGMSDRLVKNHDQCTVDRILRQGIAYEEANLIINDLALASRRFLFESLD